jgi:hypothetical protein
MRFNRAARNGLLFMAGTFAEHCVKAKAQESGD